MKIIKIVAILFLTGLFPIAYGMFEGFNFDFKHDDVLDNHVENKVDKMLFEAICNNNLDELKDLIKNHGGNINARTTADGKTLLHMVAGRGNLLIVKYLVEQGANIEAIDVFKQTPLHNAVNNSNSAINNNKNLAVMKYLIEQGANIEACDCFGATPLGSAICINNLEMVKYLVEQDANIVEATEKFLDKSKNDIWQYFRNIYDFFGNCLKNQIVYDPEIRRYKIGKHIFFIPEASDGRKIIIHTENFNVPATKYLRFMYRRGNYMNALILLNNFKKELDLQDLLKEWQLWKLLVNSSEIDKKKMLKIGLPLTVDELDMKNKLIACQKSGRFGNIVFE